MAISLLGALHLNEHGHAAKHLESHGDENKRHAEVLDPQNKHGRIVAVIRVGDLALNEELSDLLDVQLLLKLQGLVDHETDAGENDDVRQLAQSQEPQRRLQLPLPPVIFVFEQFHHLDRFAQALLLFRRHLPGVLV
jgi:hypothetical protein